MSQSMNDGGGGEKVDLNPGTYEDLHKSCQTIFPMPFEGARFMVNKGLSNNFQISHTMTLTGQSGGYRFGGTYVGSKLTSPTESFPVLIGDMDPSGNLNANIIHAFSPRIRSKFIAQILKCQWLSTQMTTDYRGDLYTASVTVANPNLIDGVGMGVFHYLRAITKNVSVGAELAYQASPQLPGGHVAVNSVSARYTGGSDTKYPYTVSGSIGTSGQLHTCFVRRCGENLRVGVEVETNLAMGESNATLGYELELPKANFTFRGCIDSSWIVRSVVEKKLAPLPFTLALCSVLDNRKNKFQFGCGVVIG